jgi:O-succinylbenzoic acid--CoA ligase
MFEGPFHINGYTFSRESLLEYCNGITDGLTNGMATGVKDGKIAGLDYGKTTHMNAGLTESGERPEWKEKLYRFIADLLQEDHPIVQQTSGTTGDPKGYTLDRTAMLHSAQMTLSFFGLQPGNTALLCLPVDYIAGKMMVVRAFLGKLHLLTNEPSGNPLDQLSQPVDFAAMVPLQVFEALKTPEKLNETIGTLLIGGGEISETLRKEIGNLDRIQVYESFAMTETLTHFALRRLNGPEADTLFNTLDGVTIGSDDRGCLTVTIEGITRGTIQTNDLVNIHAPRAFEWLGRYDNVIKSGGIKVIPEKIETIAREITGREAVVVPLPDNRLGQRLVLVLEGDEPGNTDTSGNETGKSGSFRKDSVTFESLQEALKARLEKHEIPKEIRFLKKLPRNRSMKIDRLAVQRMTGAPGQGSESVFHIIDGDPEQ